MVEFFIVKNDEHYMAQALKLAEKGLGLTSPNPTVGAVIVKNGQVIGRGYHKKAGTYHAEINALQNCQTSPKGAALYVTLEPCSTYGKTPPCTEVIRQAGIKKVIIGTLDPNPLHYQKSLAFFKKHHIGCLNGILEKECRELNKAFNKYIAEDLPYVTVKAALSLDGKIATKTNDSKWITGRTSRQYVHKLRSQVDAVLVGQNTFNLDNPKLNVRMGIKTVKHPLKIILDSNLCSIDIDNFPKDTIIATTGQAPELKIRSLKAKKAQLILAKLRKKKIDLKDLAKRLAKKSITHLLVEGGGETIASFFEQKLVDEVIFFIAPKIIGGKEAKTPVEGSGIAAVKNALNIDIKQIKKIDNDIMIKGVPKYKS